MSAKMARFLRQIPQSNQPAQPIEALANGLSVPLLRGYVLMLKTLGVVKINPDGCIQASSQTAKYMLESLASFEESDLRLIEDWHTRGLYREGNSPFQNGASLLHEMEQRRLIALTQPPPSRREYVAQVLIKRTNDATGVPELLMQYDENADQFQLIGGRRKDKGETLEITMRREIDEEIANHLIYGQDYRLICVAEDIVPPLALSPTFGALTEYHFWIFHMVDLAQPLELQPGDQWVPVDHVIAGRVQTPDGRIIESNANEIYGLIDQHLAGGVRALPDSFRRN